MPILVRVLEAGGEGAAAALVAKPGSQAETAREPCYRLYVLSDHKRRAAEAMGYNGLVQRWPEITRLAQASGPVATPALIIIPAARLPTWSPFRATLGSTDAWSP